MKVVITIDPALALHYNLNKSIAFEERLALAVEGVIKREDSDASVYGRLLFNRPNVIKAEIRRFE